MAGDVQVMNPLTRHGWDAMLLARPDAGIFHTARWAAVLHDAYGYEPTYVGSIDDGGLSTLLPCMEIKSALTGRRGVSLPFTDYCETLASSVPDRRGLFGHLAEFGRRSGWESIELRDDGSVPDRAPCSSWHFLHTLELSADPDRLFARLRSSTRRNVRKALREGVSVETRTGIDAVRAFYHLHCLTRKRHGLPPQPFRFFRSLHDHVVSRDHGMVLIASHRDAPVAGAVFLHFNGKAVYKYGASDRRYLLLRPNDLIMWEAIRHYALRGFSSFSFGRTEPGNEGLREFKSGWGADERIVRYYTYDMTRGTFVAEKSSKTDFRRAIFTTLPVPVSRCIGRALYRHVG